MAALLQRRPRLTMDHRFDDDPSYLDLIRPQFPREDGRIDETSEPIPLSRQEGRIDPPVAIRAALPPAVEPENQPLVRPRLVENPVPANPIPLVRNTQPPDEYGEYGSAIVRQPNPADEYEEYGSALARPDAATAPPIPLSRLERLQAKRDELSSEPKKMGFWKRLGLGALMGLGSGQGIGGMIGGAIGGAAVNAAVPSLLPKMRQRADIAQTDADIAQATRAEDSRLGRETDLARIDLTRAQTDYARERPALENRKVDLAAEKIKNDAEYRINSQNLRREVANQVAEYRSQILELRKQGLDQNDRRIQVLEDRAEEMVRHNKTVEEIRRGQVATSAKYSRPQAKARLMSAGLTEEEAERELGK